MSPECAWTFRSEVRIFAWRLTPEHERLLERVIFAGQIGYHLDYAANASKEKTEVVDFLVRLGILAQTSPNYVNFSAPVVRQAVLLYYLAPARSPLDDVDPDDPLAFFLHALPRIDPAKLAMSYALGADKLPSEACWQLVTHSIFNSALPEGCISPEVGHEFESKGRVDIYVNTKYGWGVELTREHSRLKEHFDRFQPEGRYFGMLERKAIRHWLLIDFCHTKPQERTWIDDPHVIHVVYDSTTFESAQVWQQKQQIAAVEFVGGRDTLRRGLSKLQLEPTSPSK